MTTVLLSTVRLYVRVPYGSSLMRTTESRAIGRYVAQKYAGQGTPLLPDPADLKVSTNRASAPSMAKEWGRP